MPDEVPNAFLLDEIRLNREAIHDVDDKVSGKVGRGEMLGWLGATVTLSGLIVRFAVT